MTRRGGRKSNKRSRQTRQRRQNQRGGAADGQYGFNGSAFVTAGGVPMESRDAWYSQCASAPAIQGGGGCGCMVGAPLVGGGYAPQLDNTLGKMVAGYDIAQCAPALASSAANQIQGGGSVPDELGAVSYKTGYGFGDAGVVSTPSAHYLNPSAYERTCAGGARRRRRRRLTRRRR